MKLRHLLAAGAVLLVGAGIFLLNRPAPPAAAPPSPSATVSEVPLVRQSEPLQVDAFGSVVAGAAESDITLAAPGIVSLFMVQPGQPITAGQELADITPDPQSLADLRKAQFALAAAGAARDHVAALLAQHLATNADLAAATQIVQNAQADLAAARATGAGTQRRILAPFAGIATAISAAPGAVLPAGAPLLQLAAIGGLCIRVGVPETDARRVRPGDAATVSLLNSGNQIAAIVTQRAAMLDPQTGLVDVTLLPKGAVLLGEPVTVTITAGSVSGFPVPRDAVLSDEQGDYVYLLDSKNIAHRQNVQVLETDGGISVLAPDLDAGMRLATTGAYQLSDGMTATLQGAAP